MEAFLLGWMTTATLILVTALAVLLLLRALGLALALLLRLVAGAVLLLVLVVVLASGERRAPRRSPPPPSAAGPAAASVRPLAPDLRSAGGMAPGPRVPAAGTTAADGVGGGPASVRSTPAWPHAAAWLAPASAGGR